MWEVASFGKNPNKGLITIIFFTSLKCLMCKAEQITRNVSFHSVLMKVLLLGQRSLLHPAEC